MTDTAPVPDGLTPPPSSPADESGVSGPGCESPSPSPDPGDAPEFPAPASQLGPVYLVDPGSIAAHPLADLLPTPSRTEQEQLYTSIAVNGQQVEGIVLDGRLLDGRSRRGVCEQLVVRLARFSASSGSSSVCGHATLRS